MSTKRRKRHSPEQVVKTLRDADAMLNAAGHKIRLSRKGIDSLEDK